MKPLNLFYNYECDNSIIMESSILLAGINYFVLMRSGEVVYSLDYLVEPFCRKRNSSLLFKQVYLKIESSYLIENFYRSHIWDITFNM